MHPAEFATVDFFMRTYNVHVAIDLQSIFSFLIIIITESLVKILDISYIKNLPKISANKSMLCSLYKYKKINKLSKFVFRREVGRTSHLLYLPLLGTDPAVSGL